MPDKIDIRRALTTDTTGSLPAPPLSQPVIDKLVTQLVDYNNPIRQNMPRKKGSGYAWHINRRTPITNVNVASAASTSYAFQADTTNFDSLEATGTYAQHDFIFRTIGAQGKVTRKAQAVGQSYSNILADELEAKAMEYRDKEEWAMIWSASGSTLMGYDANGFDGLYQLCDATNRFISDPYTGGTAHTLTLSVIDEALDAIRGDCNMIITSKKGRRIINALLQSQQRFNDKITVKGGFRVLSYNDIPIFTCSNMPDTGALDTDFYGTTNPGLTNLTASDTSTILCLDTSKVFMGVLTEITVQPLAKDSSQYDKFDLYCDEVVVCRDPRAISAIHFDR